jgi:hypothetical protein
VPFAAASQKVQVSVMQPPADWTARSVSVKVHLDSGLNNNLTNVGGVKVYAKSANYAAVYGTWINLDSTTWITASLNVSNPAYAAGGTDGGVFDAAQIVEFGIELATGSQGTYTPAVVHVDTFSLKP